MPKASEHKTPPAEILRAKDVMAMTGIRSQGHIEALIKEGKFPQKVKIGKRAVGWLTTDVKAWIASLSKVEPDAAA